MLDKLLLSSLAIVIVTSHIEIDILPFFSLPVTKTDACMPLLQKAQGRQLLFSFSSMLPAMPSFSGKFSSQSEPSLLAISLSLPSLLSLLPLPLPLAAAFFPKG